MRRIFLISFVAFLGVVIGTQIFAAAVPATQKKRRKPLPWSFHPLKRPALPEVSNSTWMGNPIDAFILAKLEEKGLKPSPPASRQQLIRRLSFDLIGLPPSPQEVGAFVNDTSSNAYEKLVNRLLNSPRYGERWALYWLDLVRYAESDGFRADGVRPTAWRYRDYVIKSFNNDKPYDKFIREQIAGDELYPDNPEAIIATAFNRHFPDEHNARNLDQRRQEILNDITDVTAQVFLGLTFGCARCHNHRFDPISQKDYYRFQAFFAAFSYRDDLPLVGKTQRNKYKRQLVAWKEKTTKLRQQIAKLEAPYRARIVKSNKSKFQKILQDAYDIPFEKRTPFQKQIADMLAKQLVVKHSDLVRAIKKKDVRKRWEALQKQLKKFDRIKPRPLPVSMGITDIGPKAPPVFFLQRGNFRKRGDEVQPDFPGNLRSGKFSGSGIAKIPEPKPDATTTGRRAVLANWLSSPTNPLTARVMMNRLWQHHFGQGIAGTPSDLGNEGEQPTHPQLLDWLATEFIKRGWSLKQMHRLMVTSNTYRQTSSQRSEIRNQRSEVRDQKSEVRTPKSVDPQNRLLWRMNLRRLEGETLRDTMLVVGGQMNFKMGGSSVFPALPKGVSSGGGWKTTKDPRQQNRRSIYVFLKRNLRYPLFSAFDAPDSNESCARRHVATNAPQALMLLNGEFSLQMAKAFASRLLQETNGQPDNVVRRAYRLALGRSPDEQEMALSKNFLDEQMQLIREKLQKKQPTPLPSNLRRNVDRAFAGAVVEYCHVVLNLNEFLYVD